jgi:hypothetical protein
LFNKFKFNDYNTSTSSKDFFRTRRGVKSIDSEMGQKFKFDRRKRDGSV